METRTLKGEYLLVKVSGTKSGKRRGRPRKTPKRKTTKRRGRPRKRGRPKKKK